MKKKESSEWGRQTPSGLDVPQEAKQNRKEGGQTMKKMSAAMLMVAVSAFQCSCGKPEAAEGPTNPAPLVVKEVPPPDQGRDDEPARVKSLPVGVVGTWLYADIKGLKYDTDSTSLIEFTDQGAFRWFSQSADGTKTPTERKGSYSVSNDTVTLRYEGKEWSETRQFLNKGRVLLLRAGPDTFKNYNEPYWEYFYRCVEGKQTPREAMVNEVLQALRDRIQITGTITTCEKEYYINRGYPMGSESGTYSQWIADIAVSNTLPFDIDLGNTFIVAQHPEEGLATGFVRIRGVNPHLRDHKTPPRPHSTFLLDDFDSTGGGCTAVVGGGKFVADDSGKHSAHAGFDRIVSHTPYVFFEEMNPNTWLKPEAITAISIILPEFIVHTPRGTQGYQVILSMQKDAGTKSETVWSVRRFDVIPMEHRVLREMLTSAESTIFRKVLAVNWIALVDAGNASPELAGLMGSKTEGNVLAACLTCYEQYGLSGFEARAAQLEYDSGAAIGIQLRATAYLDQIGYRRQDVVSASTSTNALPDPSPEGAQRLEPPSLGTDRLVAVRFAPVNKIVVRRIVVDLGRSSNPKLSLYGDSQGLPGVKVAEFSGSGDDFRGERVLEANDACWIALSSETIPGWAAPFWSMCPRDSTFGPYATSDDGGKTWSPGTTDCALKTTVYWRP